MPKQLTTEDFQQSLTSHIAQKGDELWCKYGPEIGWAALLDALNDRSLVRYPCEIVFDASALLPGEFAHPVCKGAEPNDGFAIYVHPIYSTERDIVPYLVLYQLVVVNYGEFASADDAETFAAHALGLAKDVYYNALCALANELERVECGACG